MRRRARKERLGIYNYELRKLGVPDDGWLRLGRAAITV